MKKGQETLYKRYEEAIQSLPSRGCGQHQHLPKITNYAIMLGIPLMEVENDILHSPNSSTLRKNELSEAYQFSSKSVQPIDFDEPRPQQTIHKPAIQQPTVNKKAFTFNEISRTGNLMDLIELSPVRLIDDRRHDSTLLLEVLYKPSDVLFIGDTFTTEVKTADEWMRSGMDSPHIIPNPMTGDVGLTSLGNKSKRCEATVKECRYVVVEMDEIPIEQQVEFWIGMIEMDFPVSCVIHSGGKSLHGWLRVNSTHEKWEKDIKDELFGNFLIPVGADRACSNKARLSRLPGYYRENKSSWQRLLYLKED